ncbi:4-diphosphocytidyl-2c-methyl-d-erythritol kinase [Tribonema minus]|uniref:4-(cytidine 5'-diphospho)-2-C-methyl-D-erythritol kinase n=1 Tax=Tribonema minus TaxID=303371 RepID=A0A835Z2M9_9STRA|nr:4-diphosphocytidyl-2c-methyl-d-erythritol kinase [Tribonema minus]
MQFSTASQDLTDVRTGAHQQWDLELFSPAKINLFLRIMGKRPDNYHELASLFQTVGFGDNLYFAKLPEDARADAFTCTAPNVPSDKSNLVMKALDLFRAKTGTHQFFRVHLDKLIPAQAGMGGGSGDAATTLFAANELTGCPATPEQLVAWSGDLGSDITFFLSSGTCYCTGRGEVLHPQPNIQAYKKVWLIKPEEGLSTPMVFKHLDYNELSSEDPLELLKSFQDKGIEGATYLNDLEPPAFKALPMLKQMKQDMQAAGFKVVLMSGSGTTLFALGDPADRDWPIVFTRKWGCNIWRTEFINRPEGEHLWYRQERPYGAEHK